MNSPTNLSTTAKLAGLLNAIVLIVLAGAAPVPAAEKAQQEDFIEIADGIYVVSQPDPIAEFRMSTQNNRPFTNADFNGRWSFVFFGFTHCPDLCPTTLAAFKRIHAALARQPGGADGVQFILVSVDPERDTPARLKTFVDAFHPDFVGLTGDSADLERLSQSVGARYAKTEGPTRENYWVDHSSAVLLIDPRGRLHAIFAAPHVPSKMADAFLQIRARAQKSRTQTTVAPLEVARATTLAR